VVVQLAIEIYSLPVSTANGIKLSFIIMSATWNLFIYSVRPTRYVNILSF
jgi:hypothetical protein